MEYKSRQQSKRSCNEGPKISPNTAERPVPQIGVRPDSEDMEALKSSKAPTNYFTPNILRKSWSRLVVSVVHLDALAFPVAAT